MFGELHQFIEILAAELGGNEVNQLRKLGNWHTKLMMSAACACFWMLFDFIISYMGNYQLLLVCITKQKHSLVIRITQYYIFCIKHLQNSDLSKFIEYDDLIYCEQTEGTTNSKYSTWFSSVTAITLIQSGTVFFFLSNIGIDRTNIIRYVMLNSDKFSINYNI